jgi:hypothetical protein
MLPPHRASPPGFPGRLVYFRQIDGRLFPGAVFQVKKLEKTVDRPEKLCYTVRYL